MGQSGWLAGWWAKNTSLLDLLLLVARVCCAVATSLDDDDDDGGDDYDVACERVRSFSNLNSIATLKCARLTTHLCIYIYIYIAYIMNTKESNETE